MITSIWSGVSPISIVLLPLSWLYGLITAIIRYIYRRGWRTVHHFPLPIVVVGNLTAGGNGKTPLVLWLVTKLQQRGWQVGVIARGYGGRSAHYPLLLDVSSTSEQCGDEPFLIWQRTGVPVAVAPQRTAAAAALLRAQPLDVVITDDGLQHYALGRDIEWVVIDGERRFGNGWLLPAGPMRERAKRLRQVQAVIVNGGDTRSGEVPMRLEAGAAVHLLSGEHRAITGLTPMVAMAGIGNPARFFATLRARGVIPAREFAFSDHQAYRQHMLEKLATPDEYLLMTEKDAVKCYSFARDNWWYLPVYALLPADAEQFLLMQVEQSIRHYQSEAEGGK
ncbi:Tetraacyldisaccharide 4'-kinase [Candidatus Moranella endobia PCVAL]|uniref:Tetraacyldisaccharide 4'-kinase n=1 Tax=Moranella endobia (strain PCIT) TaxID=903503 RepID=F7XY32_MOREP|nr:tetraacyldisaccharide 4'-kinase [Candidatus Moranella endobia]AEI75008.1 tetraacyldisaccharide 4'-kinase [Candidatus Moranella endobia PCIT]AGJ61256.1 Tetraacyldisaccharide 4'-kinase [Candidatus Moranella endobia PCVAL]